MPLRSDELLALVNNEDGVKNSIQDLGYQDVRKRLGRMYLKEKEIVLDTCLFAERKVSLPFVTAHEFAHWVLHRDCAIAAIRAKKSFPEDGTEEAEFSNLRWTSLQWIEWQASKLVAAMLIPKAAAIIAIWTVQSELAINTRKGLLYENSNLSGRVETMAQLSRVSEMFGVSKTVAKIRLRDIGLYHQQTPSEIRTNRSARNPFGTFLELTERIV